MTGYRGSFHLELSLHEISFAHPSYVSAYSKNTVVNYPFYVHHPLLTLPIYTYLCHIVEIRYGVL